MAKKTKDSKIELETTKNATLPKNPIKELTSDTKTTLAKVGDSIKRKKNSDSKVNGKSKRKKIEDETATKKETVANNSDKTKTSSTKKTSTKKNNSNKTATKTTTNKKKSTTKSTTSRKKYTTKIISNQEDNKPVFKSEYYDLPYSYNKTIVKILAQTPTTLFVYWEISEDNKKQLKETYGENFFEVTKPVLILYNDTLNYSFEIELNDFANSWYIHVNDSNCNYRVELGRKPIPMANSTSNQETTPQSNSSESNIEQSKPVYIPYYIYITSSNEITAPNNRILLKEISKVTFRNIKTDEIKERTIKDFKFITNYGTMNLEDIYQYLYPYEDFSYEKFLRNPSSGELTSSRSFSSKFK